MVADILADIADVPRIWMGCLGLALSHRLRLITFYTSLL